MHLHQGSALAASLAVTVLYGSVGVAQEPVAADVHVGVTVLKLVSPEPGDRVRGQILLGPQTGLELEWHLHNDTGATVTVQSPNAVVRLRVSSGGRDVPVRTVWAQEMRVGSWDRSDTLPRGPVTLSPETSFWVRGSTRRIDGAPFGPGTYALRLDRTDPHTPTRAAVIPTIRLNIVGLTTRQQWQRFHMIEGGFYRRADPERALEHYAALAKMPGATWTDSLPLAGMYSELGRYREAAAIYRRILPDLIRSLDVPHGYIIRDARHLWRAAMNLAADGDTATAANLLRLEGRTPVDKIPQEIERIRQMALSRKK